MNQFPEEKKEQYYTVGFGQETYISDTTKIKFTKLISDTRCPVGMRCETRGEALIMLQLIDDVTDFNKAYISQIKIMGLNRDSVTHELLPELLDPENEMPYLDKLIIPLDLQPVPSKDRTVNPDQYRLLFKVEKR